MAITPRKTYLPVATAVFGKEEEKEVIATIRSGWITLGPRTKQFEENLAKYIGVKHAIAVSSGSAALHLALLVIGIKPGDEVITTPFTFAATINAILHCGATPVFVDIDPKTFTLDPQKIKKAITGNTKAILPVDYGGHPANLGPIMEIARLHNLKVVEDAAHTISAQYKGQNIGSVADITCFSFHPVKNMTTGDGGAIATNNTVFAEKMMVLRVNGMDKESWKRNTQTGNWDYAVVDAGFKYHMNDLGAALGLHQLKKLESFRQKREKLSFSYDRVLSKTPEINLPFRSQEIRHAYNLYPILVDTNDLTITRNEIIEHMKKYNIGTVVYYRPLHMQPYYQKKLEYKKGDFKNAEFVFERLLCLPLYPAMTIKDTTYVSAVLKDIIKTHRTRHV